MKSKKIFFSLFVIFLLALLGYFFFRSQSESPKIDSISPTSTNGKLMADSAEWNIPPLFPSVTWRTPSQEESRADFFEIYDTNGNPLKEFTGTEWIFKQNLQNGAKTFVPEFEDYYNREAEKNGWSWSIPFGNNTLRAPSADGPMGSIWGYWKRSGGLVRLIGLNYATNYADFSPETGGACPCSEELRVFLSNPFPIDKIPFIQ